MKRSILALVATALMATCLLSACEGPAERKGKKIDNAVQNVKDRIQNKGPAQKAGEKLDDATGN